MSAREQAAARDQLARAGLAAAPLDRDVDRRVRALIEAQQELLEYQRAEIARLRAELKADRMPAHDRRPIARALHAEGFSYSQIGRLLGVSQSQAHKDTTEEPGLHLERAA